MKKRILSLALVVCMLVAVMVPVLSMPAVAVTGTGSTVKFINANVTPNVTVATYIMEGDNFDFTVPEVPSDAFGWYHMSTDGVIREASTFIGEPAEDINFYLVAWESSMANNKNWPQNNIDYVSGYFSDENGDGKNETEHIHDLGNWRGNWNLGMYNGTEYNPALYSNGYGIFVDKNKNVWSYGGSYSTRMVATFGRGTAMSYTAVADGKVDITFTDLKTPSAGDGASYSDIAMAIAVNGVIVWPQAAAGVLDTSKALTGVQTFATAANDYRYGFTTEWAYLEVPGQGSYDLTATKPASIAKTGDLLADYNAFCAENNDYPTDITVKAGDRIDIVFSRINSPHIYAEPVVTYTEVASHAAPEVLVADFATSTLATKGENWYTYTGPNGSVVLTKDFGDGWGFASYEGGVATQEACRAPTYPYYGDWPRGMLDDYGNFVHSNNGGNLDYTKDGIAFIYDVPNSGTVNISSSFNVSGADTYGDVYFSILRVRGGVSEVVYPNASTTGKTIADAATEGAGVKYTANGAVKDAVDGVEVVAGDRLLFVVRCSGIESTEYTCSYYGYNFKATVTYKDIQPASGSHIQNLGENWPVLSAGTGTHNQSDDAWVVNSPMGEDWKFVNYNGVGNSSYHHYNNISTRYALTGDWSNGMLLYYQDDWAGYIARQNNTGYAQNGGAGFAYTVETDGTAAVNASFRVHNTAVATTVRASVIKLSGGVGTLLGTADYTTNGDKQLSIANASVKRGDTIMILFCGENSTAMYKYLISQPDVRVSVSGTDFAPQFGSDVDKFTDHQPPHTDANLTGNGIHGPVYAGNWSYVAYPADAINYENAIVDFYAVNGKEDANAPGTWSWTDSFFGPYTDQGYGNQKVIFRSSPNSGDWGANSDICVGTKTHLGGYRYTVETAGYYDISVDSLITKAVDNKEDGSLLAAIYVGGEKIWPAGENWFPLTPGIEYAPTVTVAPELKNVFVGANSTVEFLIKSTNDLGVWVNRGTTFDGAVAMAAGSVLKPFETETAGAASISDTVVAEVFLSYNGVTYSGMTAPVAPKNIVDEVPYTVKGDVNGDGAEEIIYRGTITTAEVLRAYLTDPSASAAAKAVAKATLAYGAAAQTYFGHETGNLATSETVTAAGNYTETTPGATLLEGAPVMVDIAGAALLLGDQIQFKIVFESETDVATAGYMMQVSATADFASYESYALEAREGEGYKAISGDVAPNQYDTAYYFRVVDADGNAVSHTLKYSVAAYCARVTDAKSAPMTNAIMAMYDAFKAYGA